MKTKVKAQSASVPLCLCAFVPLYLCVASTCGVFAAEVEIEDGVRQGLIGHWAFDDLTEGTLRNSARIGLDATVRGDVSLEDGVFAEAACLKGRHAIHIKANETFKNLPSITISAWVSPKELSGFREIFRKELNASDIGYISSLLTMIREEDKFERWHALTTIQFQSFKGR